jgi:glycosyltransferase involved in cell wall biosynthesis
MRGAGNIAFVLPILGYIADEDLAAIYSSAYGFLYVSHYEGFGLPLLEAMSCGVPVIYGNNSSMPEIVGNAGLAADSWDVDDITRQMHRLVFDAELAKSLGRAALKRSRDFSWERTAQKTLAAYHRAG